MKTIIEILITSLIIILISPFILIIVVIIKLDGGSIIYSHKRIGKNGKFFKCYKFRSMKENSEQLLQMMLEESEEIRKEWKLNHKIKNDPRITKIGKIIRKYSIDELPQLINVLKGEMSLVGPRPIVEEEIIKYGDNIKYYMKVKPGITGLWQVSGRSDTSYQKRIELDVKYVKEKNIILDLKIIFKTIWVIIDKNGAY